VGITGTVYFERAAYIHTIDALKLAQANTDKANVTASLSQLETYISTMHASEQNYQNSLDAIHADFASIGKGLNNAVKAKPLPVDCVPDADRLRFLTAATAAANKATGTSP